PDDVRSEFRGFVAEIGVELTLDLPEELAAGRRLGVDGNPDALALGSERDAAVEREQNGGGKDGEFVQVVDDETQRSAAQLLKHRLALPGASATVRPCAVVEGTRDASLRSPNPDS